MSSNSSNVRHKHTPGNLKRTHLHSPPHLGLYARLYVSHDSNPCDKMQLMCMFVPPHFTHHDKW